MKRRKDDEKVMGPMFPRLNVNDTERVGPRAPPRNKMALYEQLSISSQRFNSNLNSSLAASSTQGSENKRPMFFPLHLPSSTPLADNANVTSSDFNISSAAPQKRLSEEDFSVPVFVVPENGENNNISNNVDRETVPLSRPAPINRSSRNQRTCNIDIKQNSSTISGLRQEDGCQAQKHQCPPEGEEEREHIINNVQRLQSTNSAIHHEVIDKSHIQSVHNATSNGEYHKDETGFPLRMQNGDIGDDDSDTSMLDSVSAVYITPDDVVGLIGQKHFWKARRAIVNQQRVFAVQVFELHRLIKVQKLFAGSSNLALENSAFPGKSLKTSVPKQISLEFIVKPPAIKENHKENNLNNPGQISESSAENGVGKKSPSSSQNVCHHHLSNQLPFSSNPQSTPVTPDPITSPWYLNQPSGHHWLVPVMSPTEGLIYKPYAGPAHTGTNPMIMSNFSNPPPYGIANFSMTHHGYFPPYVMPPVGPAFSSVDQQQDSCNEPENSNFVQTMMGKESSFQTSMGSSPRGERNRPLLFTTTTADDVATENVSRVIKIVPRDAVSANETAFRIFQSIQKEREQYKSL